MLLSTSGWGLLFVNGLSRISNFEADMIARAFPNLRSALENDAEPLTDRVAISIFDRWLEKDLHLLDCKSVEEREERNARMLCFWEAIFDLTSIYAFRRNYQQKSSPTVKLLRYTDKAKYIADCVHHPDKTSDRFQFIILPEFQAIYQENWDDTNVLWFVFREKVEPLLQQAAKCGLFAVEYAV